MLVLGTVAEEDTEVIASPSSFKQENDIVKKAELDTLILYEL